MKTTLKARKDTLLEKSAKRYYKPFCEHCNEELFIDNTELKLVLFEPHEVEEERIVFEYDEKTRISKDFKREKHMVTRSSDPKKDYFECECPVCNKINKYTNDYLKTVSCNSDGDKCINFKLSESETKKVNEFIKNHYHTEEFMANGKLGFSTIGMMFTFKITPSTLGNFITITCNHCNESLDVTDINKF